MLSCWHWRLLQRKPQSCNLTTFAAQSLDDSNSESCGWCWITSFELLQRRFVSEVQNINRCLLESVIRVLWAVLSQGRKNIGREKVGAVLWQTEVLSKQKQKYSGGHSPPQATASLNSMTTWKHTCRRTNKRWYQLELSNLQWCV